MLSFVPIGKTLIPMPGADYAQGAPPKRLCARVKGDRWEMSGNPHSAEEGSREAENLIRMVARGDIAPADEATAKASGVPFRAVTYSGAEQGWQYTTPKSRSAAKD